MFFKHGVSDSTGPRTAQGLTKAALEAAQSAVNQRLSGGGSGSRSSGGSGGGKVSLMSFHSF